MAWEIILLDEVTAWFTGLDSTTGQLVTSALDLLEERGPMLGRPLVDTLTAGDKAGQWSQWYKDNIPLTEQRYALWLAGHYDDPQEEP